MRYEYYIHYMGIDRRNDRWVTEQFIRIDKDEIERQQKIYDEEQERKNAAEKTASDKLFYNNENHGMNEKMIEEFIKSTKIKTVESIQFGNHWLETWYFTPLPKEF